MKIHNYRQVKAVVGAPGVAIHVVAGPAEGAPNYSMRVFEIEPGCSTPAHTHNWEHEVFIISGKGMMKAADADTPLNAGDAAMVLPNEPHCFANVGDDVLRLICVVPIIDGKVPGMPPPD